MSDRSEGDSVTGEERPEAATLQTSAWATPYSLSQRKRDRKPPRAEVRVSFPHGKGTRMVTAELDRAGLLKVIANAADALRLLDETPDA